MKRRRTVVSNHDHHIVVSLTRIGRKTPLYRGVPYFVILIAIGCCVSSMNSKINRSSDDYHVGCPSPTRAWKWCKCSTLPLQVESSRDSTTHGSSPHLLVIHCKRGHLLEDVVEELSNGLRLERNRDVVTIHQLTIKDTPARTKTLRSETLQRLSDGMPPIHRLSFVNNSIAELEEDCFVGGDGDDTQNGSELKNTLRHLEISSNELTAIPVGGIAALTALETLALRNNQITSVAAFMFLHVRSRSSITTLDLSGNRLHALPDHAFLGLSSLKRLLLEKNELTAIPSNAVQELGESLEELALSVNAIHRVTKADLMMGKLRALSLDMNRIEAIPTDLFEGSPFISYLYMSNNALNSIEPYAFRPIGASLRVLTLNNNPITTLNEQTLAFTPSLIRLELAGCLIGEIQPGTFWRAAKLKLITLAANHIRRCFVQSFTCLLEEAGHFRVDAKLFSSMPFLVALDLSKNSIAEVDDFAFSGMNSLQMLDLSGNRIATLADNTVYNTFHKANTQRFLLNLADNPWLCDSKLEWLVRWLTRPGSYVKVTLNNERQPRCASPPQLQGVLLSAILNSNDKKTSPTSSSSPKRSMVFSSLTSRWSPAARNVTQKPKPAAIKPNPPSKSSENSKVGDEWIVTAIVVVGALFLLTTFCLLILRLLTISQHDVVVDGPLTDDLNDNRRTTAIIRHISAVPLTARQHEDRRRVLSNSATEAVALSERKPRHYSTPVYYSTQKRLPASRTEYCKRGAPARNGLFTASKQTPRSKLQRFNFANVEADSGGPPCKPPERTECIHPLSAVRLIDIPAPRIRTIQNYTPSFISPKDKIWFF